MPSLKDLRGRIATTKSTERITSAMKMVAAAKLKKSEERATMARPFAEKMEGMILNLASGFAGDAPPMLVGRAKDRAKTILLVVITSDRGLCGGFNGNMVKEVRKKIMELNGKGHQVKLFLVGRKGVNLLKRDQQKNILAGFEELSKPVPLFANADMITKRILSLFDAGEIDEVMLYFTKFVSALTQTVTPLSLIPFEGGQDNKKEEKTDMKNDKKGDAVLTEFEPDEEAILRKLLPQNIAVQIYRGMIESFASEQGARMTAMDNATRNAKDMINRLTITYNRSRQAQITKELIEIISGAEAL